jgi:hypothetical protein
MTRLVARGHQGFEDQPRPSGAHELLYEEGVELQDHELHARLASGCLFNLAFTRIVSGIDLVTMRFTLVALGLAMGLGVVYAGPKQCRVVNKRAAQLPLSLPPNISRTRTRTASTSTSRAPTASASAPTSSAFTATFLPASTTLSTTTSAPRTTSTSTVASASPTGFDYSKDKIRGVNLGGWLGEFSLRVFPTEWVIDISRACSFRGERPSWSLLCGSLILCLALDHTLPIREHR